MGIHSWRFIPLFLGWLALSACGGGSSSSGASQGQPGPTAFAGTYQGQVTLRAPGVNDTTPVTITVAQNGLVDIDTPGDDDGCVEDPTPGTPFLVGDRISFEESGSCFIAGVGTCDIFLEAEVRFSATDAVGDGVFQIACPGFQPINGTLGLGANKV